MADSIITVENVSKTVAGRQLLSGVSCAIAPRSLVSLIGPNGAGKTTLVKIILGFDRAYTGAVRVHPGERIGYIPQQPPNDPYQLPLSVREYLAIGSTWLYSRRRVGSTFRDALQHVGVSPEALTQTYQSLSGGERQRVAIARALLAQPTTLVLDEPLAAVDYSSRQGLYELIRHLQQDHAMTVLLVSHDIESVVPLSDRVLCLNRTLHTDCHPRELAREHTHPQASGLMYHHC